LEAGPQLAAAALHSVVVGTVLDYPPAPENDYAQSLLRELQGGLE